MYCDIMAEAGLDLSRKFVSEGEIEERKRKRQEEWEKIRKPEDPKEAPEEEYDPRSLYERLQEQKEKKQEEYEEQFKFKNMVRGLNEDESNFLDEVSRQQSLLEKQRREEELQELKEYRISFPSQVTMQVFCFYHSKCPSALTKLTASNESKKEPGKRAGPHPTENRNVLSQAHLLAGAVKRRSLSQSSNGSKKQKQEEAEGGGGRAQTDSVTAAGDGKQVPVMGVVLPSATVCVGILPGLGAYSGSSDSDSTSDSEDAEGVFTGIQKHYANSDPCSLESINMSNPPTGWEAVGFLLPAVLVRFCLSKSPGKAYPVSSFLSVWLQLTLSGI
ncbi:protein FAM192A-like [Scleropages formosus]|uniref:Protein FAM192A-like n=1 Tax=Scleropages formosus TaxID=113540 RepID=A0A0P7U3X7_SCLFO|nr:protein FAM192A-like [Scleropages formosus]